MASPPSGQRPHISIGLGHRYDSMYFRTGDVRVEGFEVEYHPEVPPPAPGDRLLVGGRDPYVAPAPIFDAMATDPPFDVGEQAFSTYVEAVDQGKDITAIPVFPSRFFPHSQLSVRADAGISRPRDLVGKRVGVSCFSINFAVWLRGVLRHQYGVFDEAITWVTDRPEYFNWQPPERYQVERGLEGSSVTRLLEQGKVDVVSMPRGARTSASSVKALFENPYAEIRDYITQVPIFPANTVITIPKTTVRSYPQLPAALFAAFQRALELYKDGLREGTREDEHAGLYLKRLEQETGLTIGEYGFEANRRNIETMVEYCHEQGIIRRRYAPEELFLLTDT